MKDITSVINSIATPDDKEQSEKELVQIIIFSLDNEEFGVKITDVKEIVKKPDITPVPDAPNFVEGIFNLRGQVVVVTSLEKRFDLKTEFKTSFKHVIILESGKNTFGILVDEVERVLRVPKENIRPTPKMITSKIDKDYLKGVLIIKEKSKREEDHHLVMLLDLQKVFEENELSKTHDELMEKSKSQRESDEV
ncbi:chemotaxis protein CheW [Patescibacteria group bacterium]|nr:chemotaxis protein CheW [Patescibacteria group bacterium]